MEMDLGEYIVEAWLDSSDFGYTPVTGNEQ
jgi:hypothetical protein